MCSKITGPSGAITQRAALCAGLLVGTGLVPLAGAQCPLAELTAQTPASGDTFGQSLDSDSDELVVGSRYSACVFVLQEGGTPSDLTDDAYALQSQLTSGFIGDNFGQDVSLDGDHLAVGAPQWGGFLGEGMVHVYRRQDNELRSNPIDDSWAIEATLTGVQSGGAHFGQSVSLHGDRLVVGEPGGALIAGGMNHGLVHVLRHADGGTPTDPTDDTWLPEAVLVPSMPAWNLDFGKAVELQGDRLLIGAPSYTNDPSGAALVYYFRHDDAGTSDPGDDTWIQQSTFGLPPGYNNYLFGQAIDLDGDRLVIGASGAAFVMSFHNGDTPNDPSDDSWEHAGTLVHPAPVLGDHYGQCVSSANDTVLVGADKHGNFTEGSAYLFRETVLGGGGVDWQLVMELKPEPVLGGDTFGNAVRLAGSHAYVGATGNFPSLTGDNVTFGSVSCYAMVEPPWQFIDAALSGTIGNPCLLASGDLGLDSTVTVTLDHILGGSLSVIVIGVSSADVPFKGGVMVTSLDYLVVLATPATGKLKLSGHWAGTVPSGTEFYLQTWVLDEGGVKGLAATNGLKAVVP